MEPHSAPVTVITTVFFVQNFLNIHFVEIVLHIIEKTIGNPEGFAVKYHKIDFYVMLYKKISDSLCCRGYGDFCRTTEYSCRYERKSDGGALILAGKTERVGVAFGEEFPLTVPSVLPHRAYCMYDIIGRQIVGRGNKCFARGNITDFLPRYQKFRSGGFMYGSVNTATHDRTGIGSIDNGIHLNFGDVVADDF